MATSTRSRRRSSHAPSIDYYVVTRYADIEAVFLDPETYSAAPAQLPLAHPRPPFWFGGSTEQAIERAARLADPTAGDTWVTGLPDSLEQRAAESAAQKPRVGFVVIVASEPARPRCGPRTLRRDDAKAVMFSSDPTLGRLTSRLVEAAAKHRLPASDEFREQAEAGGLMSYGADAVDLGRRAASFVDRILKGARTDGEGPRPDDSSVSARQSGQGHLVKPAAMSDPPSR